MSAEHDQASGRAPAPEPLTDLRSRTGRGLTLAFVIFLVALLGLPWVAYRTLVGHSEQQALREAEEVDNLISAVRSYYARNVSGRVLQAGGEPISVTERYHETPGAIPIPATLSIEIGELVSADARRFGFGFAFLSDAPFRNRVRAAPDGFQQQALEAFRRDASLRDFWRVEASDDKQDRLRYATPVRMEAACVACHNAHPDSPVRTWKVGDVRGLQEVSVGVSLASQADESVLLGGYLVFFVLATLFALREYRRGNQALRELNAALVTSRNALAATAEELRVAKEAAEQSARAKANFVANMSHEIRTPMNAILGMTYLAMRTELTDPQREFLRKIQGAGRHLLGVINDILDYSRIEAGRMSTVRVPFLLDPIVANAIAIVEQKARERGLALSVTVADDVPPALLGDPQHLTQVLVNLLSNAVKFTERGSVKVRVHALPAPAAEEASLRFEVADTGIGLTEEQIGRLFQSFEQADDSTTRRYGGTGLGLAISKHLVGMMGGEIGVDSRFGEGATFWFTIVVGLPSDGVSTSWQPPREVSIEATATATAPRARSEGGPAGPTVGVSPGTGAPVALTRAEREAVRSRARRLLLLLDGGDTDVIDEVDAARTTLAVWMGADWPALEAAIKAFDFELAHDLIQARLDEDLSAPTAGGH